MKSFEPGFVERQPISQGLLRTLVLIGEFRGKEALFKQQSPQVLDVLRQAAVIQSAESSNRIEGITAPPDRIVGLVSQKTTPQNRSEQEIAGYRDVLNTIHVNAADMPVTSNVVLQLHRDMYKFMPDQGGRWKPTDNEIIETNPDGSTRVRFKPVPAFQTAEAMERLHEGFVGLRDGGVVEPLLLIPTYVFDFLCIHPFRDGNGRMSRLLTLLLMYQTGHEVGRYVSLEKIVEDTKEGYYSALEQSSVGWHGGRHSLVPWWEYFLGVVLLSAYREFERRVGVLTTGKGAKQDLVRDVIDRLPGTFQYADVERACPGVSRPTINRVLAELRRSGVIHCTKSGRDATWEKT